MSRLPQHVNPQHVAPVLGKYSHLSRVPGGMDLVFIAGQVGNDLDGAIVGPGSYEQTIAALQNIEALLRTMDAGPGNLVRLLSFVRGEANLPGFYAARDEVYAEWFPTGGYPGHSLAVVVALADPALTVEIEGWAAVPAAA